MDICSYVMERSYREVEESESSEGVCGEFVRVESVEIAY